MRLALFPIISFAHRRLSSVSGTKTKCRWGVFSSMCTTADTILSFPTRPIKKSAALWEKFLYLLWGLLLEKLRAGANQRIHKPGAVLTGTAASLFNAVLNEVVISSLWLDDVEIVLAPAGVNVGIAGVLFLLPFVMGFQRSCRIALVFFKSQNCVLCHETPFPIPFSFPGLFHRKIPQKISRIG